MKKQFTKIISAVSAIVMAASATGVISASAETIKKAGYRTGDLDGDKQVTLKDALGSLIIYTDALMGGEAGKADASGAAKAADIDNSGSIDLSDALSILQYYSGSLTGEERLWADIRPVTNVDVTKYHNSCGEKWTIDDMYLEIGCAAGAPGDEVTVPVYIAGAAKIAGFQYFQLVPEGYEIVDIESPAFSTGDRKPTFNTDAGTVQIDYDDPTAEGDAQHYTVTYQSGAMVYVTEGGRNVDVSDGTILAYFTYKIPEDAVSGTFCPLTAEIDNSLFVTEDLKAYNFTLIDGIILVK